MESDEDFVIGSQQRDKKKKKKSKKKASQEDPDEEIAYASEEFTTPKKKKKKKSSSPPEVTRESGDVDIDDEQEYYEQPTASPASTHSTPKKKPKITPQKKSGPGVNRNRASEIIQIAASNNQKNEEYVYGMNILMNMSKDDLDEFLNRVDMQCPADDSKKLGAREDVIDWQKVAFSSYDTKQCKCAWGYLRNNARKFRILHEVVEEVKVNFKTDLNKWKKKMVEASPDFPQKPYGMGAFHLFCKESWDKYKAIQEKMNAKSDNFLIFQTKCHEKWGKMSEEVKQEFDERAKLQAAEYKRKVKEYYAKYPGLAPDPPVKKLNKDGKPENDKMSDYMRKQALKLSNELYKDAPDPPLNPQKLFINSKLNRLEPHPTADEIGELKLHYMDKWKNLSNKKKLKWIESCIRKCETYMEAVREYKKAHPLFFLPKELQISSLISKEDFAVWAEAHGKPPNPRKDMFDVFYEEFINSEEAIGSAEELRAAAQAKWKDVDWYHKEMYKMQHKMQQVNFKRDIESYFSGLPQILKAVALESIPKKFHKPLMEDVDKEPLPFDEDSSQNNGSAESSSSRKRNKGTGGMKSDDDTNIEKGVPSPAKKKIKMEAKDLPLYMVELTDDHKQLIHQKMQEEKEAVKNASMERGKKHSLKTKSKIGSGDSEQIGEAIVESLIEHPIADEYFPGKEISPRTFNEAVRGIFDGLQSVGRCFSVYYFYAKYVAREKSWAQLYSEIGIVETAVRMIETFNRLSKHQQQIFIDEALKFYKNRNYGRKISSEEDVFAPNLVYFPDEPAPPPRNAVIMYNNEMRLKQMDNADMSIVPWEELDDKAQMHYLKKLYKSTKNYIKEYESFVKNMTPNDMLEYFTQRCNDLDNIGGVWCHGKRSIRVAAKGFIQPLARGTYSAELSDDGQESQPEVYETDGNISKKLSRPTYKYKKNPFSVCKTRQSKFQKNCLVRRLSSKDKTNEQVDSDLPSSSSSDDEDNMLRRGSKLYKRRQFEKKLKDLEKYYYPLEDLYDEPTMRMNVNAISKTALLQAKKLVLDRYKQNKPEIQPTQESRKAILKQSKPKAKHSERKSRRVKSAKLKGKAASKIGSRVKKLTPRNTKSSTIANRGSTVVDSCNSSEEEEEPNPVDETPALASASQVVPNPGIIINRQPRFALVRSSPQKSTENNKHIEKTPVSVPPILEHIRGADVINQGDPCANRVQPNEPSADLNTDLVVAAMHFADDDQLEVEKSLKLKETMPGPGEFELLNAGDHVTFETADVSEINTLMESDSP